MLYVLAYPEFSDAIRGSLAKFRETYEPERARLVAPHVTLMFGVPPNYLRDVSKLAERAVATTETFSIVFESCVIAHDPFEQTNKLVLNVGDGRKRLIKLHQILYDGPHRQEFDDNQPFAPHMTIASDRRRTMLETLDVRDMCGLPLRATISALDLVRVSDGRLTHVQTFQFGR